MKTITMDYNTYKDELSGEFYKGHQRAITWLFDEALKHGEGLVMNFMLEMLARDENFELVTILEKKRYNYTKNNNQKDLAKLMEV